MDKLETTAIVIVIIAFICAISIHAIKISRFGTGPEIFNPEDDEVINIKERLEPMYII